MALARTARAVAIVAALSFGLLRAVPLGRAIFGTGLGALLAFTVAVFAQWNPLAWLPSARSPRRSICDGGTQRQA